MSDAKIRKEVADILYDAFADKIENFWFFTSDKKKSKELIAMHVKYDQLLVLKNDDGEIVAVSTIETSDSGHAVDVPYATFRKHFGVIGGLIRRICYAIYKNSQNDIQPDDMYVDLAAVKKFERSNGYGAQLFEKIENHAKKLDKPHVKLDVVNNNDAAKRFYERIGYEEIAYHEENAFFQLFTKRAGFTGHSTMFKDLTK